MQQLAESRASQRRVQTLSHCFAERVSARFPTIEPPR
jgi:hypothetical protein